MRSFPYTTNTSVTTVGGACGSAAGDPATVTRRDHRHRDPERHRHLHRRRVDVHHGADARRQRRLHRSPRRQTDTAANTGTSGAQSITINTAAPVVAVTTVNGTARTFPFITNVTVTTLGGTCTTAAGVNATVSIAITGASTQNGTATCTTGAWTFTPTTSLSLDGIYSVTATQSDTASNVGTIGRAVDHRRQDHPGRHARDGERHCPHVPVHQQRDRHDPRRHLRRRDR